MKESFCISGRSAMAHTQNPLEGGVQGNVREWGGNTFLPVEF